MSRPAPRGSAAGLQSDPPLIGGRGQARPGQGRRLRCDPPRVLSPLPPICSGFKMSSARFKVSALSALSRAGGRRRHGQTHRVTRSARGRVSRVICRSGITRENGEVDSNPLVPPRCRSRVCVVFQGAGVDAASLAGVPQGAQGHSARCRRRTMMQCRCRENKQARNSEGGDMKNSAEMVKVAASGSWPSHESRLGRPAVLTLNAPGC